MLNIFKKKKKIEEITIPEFEVELIAAVLAYEIARSDGEITEEESNLLINEIKKISEKVEKNDEEVLLLIEKHSNDSVSFHEFVEDINKDFSKEEKISLIEFLWNMAYADSKLDVDEERLIRRIADLIRIKDVDVLKLKDKAKR
ncbi:TerB family tellurite resistance protein [Gammaproteobacteria bacterium]|jgi:uncharacterized tellurite resistance protein B-like protein|nr:TerB family tellurite resistance protein [Gammaproteobacteria bacterium]MDA9355710.1 TerB family tellurite resistance protein [Gammaproteobacteria bacterium]MDB4119999.1 TerB family tellurite resistance protein [Gammaproteobacteria bacterium]MDB9747605.1 TerB family tellurite resistance protein [Gammaproteobacteria bacterium]MDC1190018.1 TerB family tellurite resistance protein [Gammaproteobacteria bacterium]|tara:strand:- start:91 stop:522 length:432 start_codon:yes stop_codon:yes gene_type:complete